MNWRRGLLLAGIHLTVAGTLLVWVESGYWRYIRSEPIRNRPAEIETTGPDGEETISFNPCDEGGGWYGTPPQAMISGLANLPVMLLTGWHTPCSFTISPLDSVIEKRFHRTRTAEIVILTILCALVAVQWFLVGGFPLIQPRRWWWEPGAFITLCTLAAFAIVLIHGIAPVAKLPTYFAGLAWLWWFGLLVWKASRAGWRQVSRAIARGR
jgi:hypothetical protein